MSTSALHAPPAPFPYVLDGPATRLLSPAPPRPARRQLRLQPVSMFLDVNHNARLVTLTQTGAPAELFPPFMPPGPPAARAPYPAGPAPSQVPIPMPCAPTGKGKSMGTSNLSRDEERIKTLVRRESLPVLPADRPTCRKAARPCAFVSCRHHLYLDVNPESGAIKVNFPGLETVDTEMVEARMGWLSRRTIVTATGKTFTARVKGGHGLARGIYSASAKTEADARRRLADILRPLVVHQETSIDLSRMEDTCSIDVGDRGERREARRRMIKLEDVGRKLNLVMERARQLLEHAQDEAHAKSVDGLGARPIKGDDPNEGENDETTEDS